MVRVIVDPARGPMARVIVDRSRCTGHGRCYVLSPDVFESDDDGYCTTDLAEVPADLLEQAERGAANCPEEAITLEAGDVDGGAGVSGRITVDDGASTDG
ncbi:MAG: ferredoxin [Acidimicrobiales bacterium]|nr:ferredoxin [Acidimicrobiales bacterium]